jgi:hypothetical protein
VGSAYMTFQGRVASMMARSRARHVQIFKAYVHKKPIHSEVDVIDPTYDDEGEDDQIEVGGDEDQWDPNFQDALLIT